MQEIQYKKEELKELMIKKIKTFDPDYFIYTDGSTGGDQKDGGAGMFIEDRSRVTIEERGFPARELCSSYAGECLALLEADSDPNLAVPER